MTGFVATCTFTTRDYRQYSDIADPHTLQFRITHALGSQSSLVIPRQRIYNNLTVTSNHTWKSSLHRLLPFFSLFHNCQFRRLDSVQFYCSQAHILAG
jgi:hypothetical protein